MALLRRPRIPVWHPMGSYPPKTQLLPLGLSPDLRHEVRQLGQDKLFHGETVPHW